MANFSTYINGETPVLVDFYAEWCNPCKAMFPILEDLKSQVGGRVIIVKVNVEKNPHIAQLYQIKSIPTLILFRKGKILWRWSGVVQKDELLRIIEPYEQYKTGQYESQLYQYQRSL